MGRLFIACMMLLSSVHCGSLINELQRIRDKSAGSGGSGTTTSTGPTVLYTIPADGSAAAAVQSYIDIVFDQAIDATSASGAGTNGTCTGTTQASYNDFANCGGTVSVTGSTVRLSANPAMPMGVAIKVQVTNGLMGTNGLAAIPYQSTTGFSFAAPCGQNCFYSDSAPLAAATVNGSHAFVIPSGSRAGGIMIYTTGTTTTYWDAQTNQTSNGPTSCGGVGFGAHTFHMNTPGYARSGHMLTPVGGGSTTICDYNPASHTISGGLAIASQTWYGSMTIPILTGGSAGMFLTNKGVNTVGSVPTNVTSLYNPSTDSYGAGPNATCSIGGGAQWYRLDTSPNIGKPWLFCGNGGTGTTLLDEGSMMFSNPGSLSGGVNNDSLLFRVNSGLYANQLIVSTQGSTTGFFYDQNTGFNLSGTFFTPLFTLGAGVQAANITSGSRSGQTLLLRGAASPDYGFYNQGTNSYSAVLQATGNVGVDSGITKITAGPLAGKFFLVNGNSSNLTSMYDPRTDSFIGTRMQGAIGNAGTVAFAIKSGAKAGKALIIPGSISALTTLYNPQTGLTELGPNMPSATGTGALSIPLSSGKQLILLGNGTAAAAQYDPASNMLMPAVLGVDYFTAPAIKSLGARHILLQSGTQINNYLIISGGTAAADFFNPNTNTFSTAGAVTGCASISGASWMFRVLSGINTGKIYIICGSGLSTSVFDPTGLTFTGGSPMTGLTPNQGAHGFHIPSGTSAGKFLFISANGTDTKILDMTTYTWSVGPALCASAGNGGFSSPIGAGSNAGKYLIALGGTSTSTCFYNPNSGALGAFSPGPPLGTHTGYGLGVEGFAFPTGGGVYPTAYVVVHGGGSNVFSHWFAY